MTDAQLREAAAHIDQIQTLPREEVQGLLLIFSTFAAACKERLMVLEREGHVAQPKDGGS